MKILKRSKEKRDRKIVDALKSFLTVFKLKEKVAQLNRKASENVRTTSVVTVSILMLSLVLGTWLTIEDRKSADGMLTGLSDVKPMFDGMHRIQKVKDMQVEQTVEMTNRGKLLKHELDSLVRLPVKTRKDSTDIIVKYKQLELVVKYLENET